MRLLSPEGGSRTWLARSLSTLRLALCALLALAGCKKFFSFGNPDASGGSGGGGGDFSSMLASLVGFEGEIDMAISMPSIGTVGVRMSVNMKLKGDRMRMEVVMPGSLGATITDGGKKKSWTLVPSTKQYTETDLDAPKPGSVPGTSKPTITKTGRTDKVAGYSCDIITMSEPGKRDRTEFCMSKGLTFLGMGMGPFSGLGGSEYGDLLKEGFPLRMQSFDGRGAEIMKMEATRIEKKSEPDSDFEVPPGWTKLASPSPYIGPAPTTGS